jgi:hypothetical protein
VSQLLQISVNACLSELETSVLDALGNGTRSGRASDRITPKRRRKVFAVR